MAKGPGTSHAATNDTNASVEAGPVVGPEWALPGLGFIDALGRAAAEADTEAIPAFYHPEARIVVGAAGASANGWRQIVDLVAAHGAVEFESNQPVPLSGWGAIVLSSGSPNCDGELCPEAWADIFVIDGVGVSAQLRAVSTESEEDPLVRLYAETALAYNAHDVDRMVEFYSRAAFAPPPPRAGFEEVFAAFPDVHAEPLTLADLGLADSSRPAVFDAGALSGSSRSRTGLGVYRLNLTPDTEMLALTMWELWDDEIVSDETVLDPAGLATYLELTEQAPDPESWFSTIEVPEPRIVERTHIVETAGVSTELYNATDALAELLEWGLGRFHVAGLPLPQVEAIYAETATTCLEGSAWAYTGAGSPHIRVCLDEDDLMSDGSLSLLARITMLHELSHVWTAEHVGEEGRLAFMTDRGLSTWNEPTAAWEARASEHAAEIMSWGLAEEPFPLVRLGEPACDEARAAFTMLTGLEPLLECGAQARES
jgi:hypothetical protein